MKHPDPLVRAPRLANNSHERFYFSPPSLKGAIVAVIIRDLRGVEASTEQLITHFPASHLLCLSWYQDFPIGHIQVDEQGSSWQPFSTAVMLSGSQSQPLVSWAPHTGRGGIICFTLEMARKIFQIEPILFHDRFVSAYEALVPSWWPFLEALSVAEHDQATLEVLERYLLPQWQASPEYLKLPLRQLGQQWVERLAWQAHKWGRSQSTRQIERRIKAYSGRSLKEWKSLVRTEAVFFEAREQYEAGLTLNWAQLAQDHEFADQAHLIRFCKRITGFTPTEFVERFQADESFWVYRLWI